MNFNNNYLLCVQIETEAQQNNGNSSWMHWWQLQLPNGRWRSYVVSDTHMMYNVYMHVQNVSDVFNGCVGAKNATSFCYFFFIIFFYFKDTVCAMSCCA